ncbi:MAG TPA: hypothetical protein PLS49_03990 [Candidatus Woesebacteria bacterium]|nr:hypothetical protein [Candidatus Woesebacteria bacterium]
MHNPIPSPLKGEGKGEVEMKQYLIKNSDIMHNGKLFPEGSTINLEDKDAESLSDYLVTLSASSRAETRDEGSTKNTVHKTNIKRSK